MANLDIGKAHRPDIKKAELREVDYQTAKRIIEDYEWLGTMGTTQYHYGIYFDGVCGGVVCFGNFQAMNSKNARIYIRQTTPCIEAKKA